MTKRIALTMSAALLLAIAGTAGPVQEKAVNPETESSVPALEAFHEIIYPIWHTAYPEKDYAALKSFVPKIDELAADIYAAALPGILRDKDAKWKSGVAEFRKSVEAYDAAAAGDDGEALLKAAETLHMRYEMLVRTIRPVLPEIDAFHKVLYVVYHTYVPEKSWDDVRKAAPELKAKAEAVAEAQLPKRLEGKAAVFQAASSELLKSATELAAMRPDSDGASLEAAVERVHTRYQAVEKVFD
jgi:hypothetical protein